MSHTFLAYHYKLRIPCRIILHEGHYQSIEPLPASARPTLPWIAPSLVDPQINGFGGVDFNSLPSSEKSLSQADTALAAAGCSHYLITFITQSQKRYESLFSNWERQRQNGPTGAFGYHLEGPFLNPDPGYSGVHHPELMRSPELAFLEQFQKLSHEGIRLMTMAPEMGWPESLEFIRRVHEQKVRVAAGHSALMDPELREAITAGLSAWTHLGNAAPAHGHKFTNVIFHALASELAHVFLIPDGLHLPPQAFRIMARVLGERLLLTTDAMAGANSSAGSSSLGEMTVQVHSDGRATLPGSEKLAGSTLSPFAGVFKAAQMSGLPWEDCWDAFSTRTAHWLGLRHVLEPQAQASFCLFDREPLPKLHQTWRRGVQIYDYRG